MLARETRHVCLLAGVLSAVAMAGAFRRVRVSGLSMAPAFVPGDRLLVVRGRRARPGEVVVVRLPGGLEAVKRVADGDVLAGEVRVLGDNAAASTDSRQHGPLPQGAVRGRVVARYHPPARAGWVDPPLSCPRMALAPARR